MIMTYHVILYNTYNILTTFTCETETYIYNNNNKEITTMNDIAVTKAISYGVVRTQKWTTTQRRTC